ncbi:MAG: magnesium transporter MgtE N-terminal domain-containing protein, partial [Akkermansiaceae bacterium]
MQHYILPYFSIYLPISFHHAPLVPDDDDMNPINTIKLAIDAEDASALLAAAEDIHYADLAELYQDLDDAERDFFMKTIGPELATDVVAELPDSLIEEALDHFKPAQLRFLLSNLSDDDRVDIFQVVSEE